MHIESDRLETSLRSAFDELAKEYGLSFEARPHGFCLNTLIGDLCALISVATFEIEVWLEETAESSEKRYSLESLAAAAGCVKSMIWINPRNHSPALRELSELLMLVLESITREPQKFLMRVKTAHHRSIENLQLEDDRAEADRAWQMHDYKTALRIYSEITDLSSVEKKRLVIARNKLASLR